MSFLQRKKGSTFVFELLIQDVDSFGLNLPGERAESFYVSVERRGKRYRTKDTSPVGDRGSLRFFQVLSFAVTLFKAPASMTYSPKRFQFKLKSRSKTKRFGRSVRDVLLWCDVNLASFASRGVRNASIVVPLRGAYKGRGRRIPAAAGPGTVPVDPEMLVTVRCRWLNDETPDASGYHSCSTGESSDVSASHVSQSSFTSRSVPGGVGLLHPYFNPPPGAGVTRKPSSRAGAGAGAGTGAGAGAGAGVGAGAGADAGAGGGEREEKRWSDSEGEEERAGAGAAAPRHVLGLRRQSAASDERRNSTSSASAGSRPRADPLEVLAGGVHPPVPDGRRPSCQSDYDRLFVGLGRKEVAGEEAEECEGGGSGSSSSSSSSSAKGDAGLSRQHSEPLPGSAPPQVTFIALAELKGLERIGQGHFSVAFAATWRGARVVVKVPKTRPGANEYHELWSMISMPPHPNVLPLLGVCRDFAPLPFSGGSALCLVTVREVPLADRLRARAAATGATQEQLARWTEALEAAAADRSASPAPGVEFDLVRAARLARGRPEAAALCRHWAHAARCGAEMAAGLAHLHACGVVHRDVSLRNYLVCGASPEEEAPVRLCDFGLSRQVGADSEYYRSDPEGLLPLRWMSPEAMLTGKCSKRSDVWSLGVSVWELLSGGGRQPYRDLEHGNQVVCAVATSAARLGRERWWPGRLSRVVGDCTAFEPSARPTAAEVATRLRAAAAELAAAAAAAAAAGASEAKHDE